MTEIVRKRSIHIRDARIAGLYDLEHTIGQGHFAVVKLARHVFTGERVAVKIIDKTNLDNDSMGHVLQEVRCMKLVQHANIVRLYEVIDTKTKMFLILELGDYDMHDFIIKHENGVEESLAQQYFCQIITAIDYCHRLHVVHRDLKPENVVFFEKLGMVKLTDFGFSNLFEPGEQLRTACGSLAYSAPEILLGDAYDAPAVDVWSLGVILFMLVCGRLPFQEANDSETLTKILDCRYSTPDHLSNACRNLIQRMLVRDPSKRAGLAEIASNAWVMAGDRGHAAVLPLIVKHHLPHSAHTTIIEQMVAGGVGSEESILRALENDEYNSMTATYYLLAERILATCREEQAKELMARAGAKVPDEELQERLGRKATETARDINEAFGPGTTSLHTVQRWFKKFRSGDENLEDDERSGRPSDVNDNQLRALVKANPCATVRKLAEELGVSSTSVSKHLKQIGKSKKQGMLLGVKG
nr:Serine threonine protein kinase-related domain containing protein [Haemonchus contortus]